jgi:hypothetical protein
MGAGKRTMQPADQLRRKLRGRDDRRNRTAWDLAGTTSFKGAALWRLQFQHLLIPPPKSVTEAVNQTKFTVTNKGGAAANLGQKSKKALKQSQAKNTQQKVKAGKSSPKIPNPAIPTPSLKSTQ